LQTVAAEKANVLEVHHDRAFVPGPIGDTVIELTLETKGASHAEQLVSALTAKGYAVTGGERNRWCGIIVQRITCRKDSIPCRVLERWISFGTLASSLPRT